MEEILHLGDGSPLSFFLWHITLVYMLVLMILSIIIYRKTADQIFILYFTYSTLLFTYLLCRNDYFPKMQHFLPIFLYSYYIQALYFCMFFHFGLSLIHFKTHYPRLTRWIYGYIAVVLFIATLFFFTTLFQWANPELLVVFFRTYIFPVHVSIALLIIFKAIKLRQEALRTYFLLGSSSFLIFASIAILMDFYAPFVSFIQPATLFYIGVLVEFTFYTIGLGTRIQQLYVGKLAAERLLNAAQMELRKMVILENKVLRSQMNSHFIFNILNSIKAFIIERDVEQAVTYLNKFSKLIRRMLDASRNESYSLADEINAIRWYVDIEKIRVSGDFRAHFDIEMEQNPEGILFPPLLIQPFVENAIWHGLSPLYGEKELIFRVRNEGSDILIEIIDNGIGYEKSLAIKEPDYRHTSHGLDITNERIELFNNKNLYRMSYEIVEDVNRPGTIVRIRLQSSDPYSN